MIYIYRRAATASGRALAEALTGISLRDISQLRVGSTHDDDLLVCWGDKKPSIWPGRVLNAGPHPNKIEQVGRLQLAGIPTINISTTKPTGQRPDYQIGLTIRNENDAEELIKKLKAYLNAPLPSIDDWLPRSLEHEDGSDLTSTPRKPDFWSQKEILVREFRVHSFLGKSIRAGQKVHRDDAKWRQLNRQPSDWIRTWREGWHVGSNETITSKHRDIANRAVKALNLDFGAVDIGEKQDGSLIVLEVNRAPGIDTGVIEAYAAAIRSLV